MLRKNISLNVASKRNSLNVPDRLFHNIRALQSAARRSWMNYVKSDNLLSLSLENCERVSRDSLESQEFFPDKEEEWFDGARKRNIM